MKPLENLINNSITQAEQHYDKGYRLFCYGWALRYMRLASKRGYHVWAGEYMGRMFRIASEIDVHKGTRYREVKINYENRKSI